MKNKRKEELQIGNQNYIDRINQLNQDQKSDNKSAQFININDFIKARSFELHHFTNILKGKISSKLSI